MAIAGCDATRLLPQAPGRLKTAGSSQMSAESELDQSEENHIADQSGLSFRPVRLLPGESLAGPVDQGRTFSVCGGSV